MLYGLGSLDDSMENRVVKRLLFLCCALLLSSCYKNHLYVQQQWVDERDLASSFVGTPDPRKQNPSVGQRVVVSWDFPHTLFLHEIDHLLVTVHFGNLEEKKLEAPIDQRRGYQIFFFPNPKKDPTKKILTYRVEVFTKEGTVFETWKHQFWTELIHPPVEEEESEVKPEAAILR